MDDFFNLTRGRVIEVRQFLNVHVRKGASQLSRERRELWLAVKGSPQRLFVIYSDALPARRGHDVSVLTLGDWVIGLQNATTGEAVNYVRHNQPGLIKLADVGVMLSLPVFSTIGLLAWGAKSLLASIPFALLYLPLAMYAHAKQRRHLQEMVDDMLTDLRNGGGPWSHTSPLSAPPGKTEN